MRLRTHRLSCLLIATVSLSVMTGCAVTFAKIREVDFPKEEALRTEWKSYHTYCLGDSAMLFELKGDKTIQKEDDWREVTNHQMASHCAGFLLHSSPVMELLGANDGSFGYLIYNLHDGVSVLIIDPKTLRLFYHVYPRGG